MNMLFHYTLFNLKVKLSFACLFLMVPSKAQSVDAGQKLVNNELPFTEKVFLHIDRDYYEMGDNIWFQAYLVNGLTNTPVNTSSNLYVELISPDSKIITRNVIRLENGMGKGDFKLDDSIPSGTYRIRAYTQWMANFGNRFLFEKQIKVLGMGGDAPNLFRAIEPPTIGFFPEGGSLVRGLECLVAFKATDSYGLGCDAAGSIVSSEGDTVVKFKTSHLGMGTFGFTPKAGLAYTAIGKFKTDDRMLDGASFTQSLPTPLPEGFVMHITGNATLLQIVILANGEALEHYKNSNIRLTGRTYGKISLDKSFCVKAQRTVLQISKSDYSSGITSFTLYDSLHRPHCERIVFIEPKQNVQVVMEPSRQVYLPRDSVHVKIRTVDQRTQQPVKASLSIAVADSNLVKSQGGNILSYLWLESEVKGDIEEPARYFDPSNVKRIKELDVLLLAQGWRNYVWKNFPDTSVRIRFKAEHGITISGKVQNHWTDNPVNDLVVQLNLPAKGHDTVLFQRTDTAGRYYFRNANFYGCQPIALISRTEKGRTKGELTLDSLFMGPLMVARLPKQLEKPDKSYNAIAAEVEFVRKEMKKYHLTDTIALPPVKIKARRKIDRDDGQLCTHVFEAWYPAYDFKITKDDYGKYKDIGDYIARHVNLVKVDQRGDIYLPERTYPKPFIRLSNDKPVYSPVIKNIETYIGDCEQFIRNAKRGSLRQQRLLKMPLYRTDRIIISLNMLVTLNLLACPDPDTQKTIHWNDGWVISLSDTAISKAYEPIQKDFSFTYANGYYEAREFYSPQHTVKYPTVSNPDYRRTLYWNPNVETDDKGEASVVFYNADHAGPISVSVQGVSAKVGPLYRRAGYVVK